MDWVAAMTGGAGGGPMRPLVLDAAGSQAAPVASLAWILFWGSVAIFAIVVAMLAIAFKGPARWRRTLGTERTVLVAGFALPVVVLVALLIAGLSMTASLGREVPNEMRVRITGYRWWWAVDYPGFSSANELVIPVGRPVRLELAAADVIHNFWVPELAGKRDMIPGKLNTLLIKADRAGTFFAICAEFCGGPHALMQFRVHALPPDRYAVWEANQRRPAAAPATAIAARGGQLFGQLGCGGCHAVAGTRNQGLGQGGPDLSHLASRSRLGAGIAPMDRATLRRWAQSPQSIKPGNTMPAFNHLSAGELDAIAAYLAGLR